MRFSAPGRAVRSALARGRRRGGEEGGAVLVLVAGLLVVFIGVLALAIDLGAYRQSQTQAQSAADAAALAGAQQIGSGTAAVTTASQQVAATNYPGAAPASVSMPTASQVKVSVTGTSQSFFGRFFGSSGTRVSASAVATETSSGPSNAAVFASNQSCNTGDGITFSGNSNVSIDGAVNSNGLLTVSSNSTARFGATTYGQGSSCLDVSDSSTFASGPTPAAPTTGWPADYRSDYPSICPTVQSVALSWTGQSSVTLNGVYCTTKAITITGNSGVTGSATLIGSSVTISGNSSFQVTPYTKGLLVYQTGSGTCSVQGDSSAEMGTIFAPNATIDFSGGSSASTTGYIEGKNVSVEGNSGFTVHGDGPPAGSGGSSVSLTG